VEGLSRNQHFIERPSTESCFGVKLLYFFPQRPMKEVDQNYGQHFNCFDEARLIFVSFSQDFDGSLRSIITLLVTMNATCPSLLLKWLHQQTPSYNILVQNYLLGGLLHCLPKLVAYFN